MPVARTILIIIICCCQLSGLLALAKGNSKHYADLRKRFLMQTQHSPESSVRILPAPDESQAIAPGRITDAEIIFVGRVLKTTDNPDIAPSLSGVCQKTIEFALEKTAKGNLDQSEVSVTEQLVRPETPDLVEDESTQPFYTNGRQLIVLLGSSYVMGQAIGAKPIRHLFVIDARPYSDKLWTAITEQVEKGSVRTKAN